MKVKGKDAFLKQISAFPFELLNEVRKALRVSAEEATDLMRRFVPDDESTAAPDLRSSIGFKFGGGGGPDSTASSAANARSAKLSRGLAVTMYAGSKNTLVKGENGKFYQNARLQEFGRKGMPANPFFFPAIRLSRKRARSRLQRSITAGARKAFR